MSIETQIKDVVVFDTLRFPYKLNLQAWIETSNDSLPMDGGKNIENDYVDCPSALIPSHEFETITISPGMTGATGPTGPSGNPGSMGDTGPIGQTGATGPAGSPGLTGTQGFLGAYGATGPMGFTGVTGPEGQIGATGLIGATGSDGVVGPVGPPGPPATSAPLDNKAASSSDGCTGFLLSENFMIGMIIWLCILSLLLLTVLVIIVALCVELRSKGKEEKEARTMQPWITTAPGPTHPTQTVQNDYHRSTLARDPQRSRLKEETESNYSLDTIETAFNGSDIKARKSGESGESPYAILHDPSTTSTSDGGVYNPAYMETASAPGDSQLDGLTHDAVTSS